MIQSALFSTAGQAAFPHLPGKLRPGTFTGMTIGSDIDLRQTFKIRPSTQIRPVSADDAASLFTLVEENRTHLRTWLPWLDGCRSESDQRSFLESVVERARAGRGAVWLIEESGSLCGVCGYNWVEPCNRVCEIGYWLATNHQGRGTMTACVERLIRHAFEDLNLNRITIPVAVENYRSRAIPERLGFQKEGVLRQAEWLYDRFVDHVMYAKVRSDDIARIVDDEPADGPAS